VALARELARVVRHAVVKLGPAGAVWASADGRTASAPAIPVGEPVDATGAGDAFAAGLLASWLAGDDPAAALAAGARLGAVAVRTLGARPAGGALR
jgi:sugar/nucleoside kinase (ribokinase family)